MRHVALLALILASASCQDPDPLVGSYDLQSVVDASQSSQALSLPATVQPGLDIPGAAQSTFVIHSGELRIESGGRFSLSFMTSPVGGTATRDGGAGTWSRTADGIRFSDGEGYEFTSKPEGNTLSMSCYGPNLLCNYLKR
jgi:hypothetical protein